MPKIMSTGVGESKQFGAGDKFDQRPPKHANGRALGKGPLDHLLASSKTDEALEDAASKPKARVTVVRDEFEKRTYDQYAADRVEAKPWMTSNPMAAMAARHCPEGHVPRFLGERKVQLDGMRGWQPVIGESGDPVKLGNMTLASMPREEAEERNAYFRSLDSDRIKQVRDETQEQTQRLARTKGLGLAKGEGGFQRSHGQLAALDE